MGCCGILFRYIRSKKELNLAIMNMRSGKRIGKHLLTMLLIGSMLLYGFQAFAPQASAAGDDDALKSVQVLVDKNVVVACHQASVENNGDVNKAAPLKSGSDHYTHRSYLSFTVPSTVTGAVYSAKLRLTPLADKSDTKLGVYAGPAVADWPTTTVGMWDAKAEPDQAVRTEHNCPSAPNTLVGQYVGTLTAGEAIEVDVSSMVDGPGTYTLMLRGLAGTSGDYSEFMSLYKDQANKDTSIRPQLVIEYESNDGDPTPSGPPADCTIIVPILKSDGIPHNGQVWGAQKGSKICIEGGPRATPILLANMVGTPDKPIEIVAYGKAVEATANMEWDAAMDIRSSEYFILNGKSIPGVEYGFKLVNNAQYGFGLQVGRGSSHYTIQGVEIVKAGFTGFMLRSDVAHKIYRDTFTQEGVVIRHNKIANASTAGQTGFGLLVGVGNFGTEKQAHETKGLRIHDNTISGTQRDGILVYGASEDVRVYNNTIENYGLAKDPLNNSGLLIGTGTSGEFYNNVILGQEGATTGRGINNQGRGNVNIYNNLMVEPGQYGIVSPAEPASIIEGDPLFVKDLPSTIRYNTIVHPLAEGSGIVLRDSANTAEGNTVDHNVIVHRSVSDAVYIVQESVTYPVSVVDNYGSNDMGSVQFVDASGNPRVSASYALGAGSPAEGHGFLPGLTPPSDERYKDLVVEYKGGKDPEVPDDPLDPEFDYENYVPDPVDVDCKFVIESNETRVWDGTQMGVKPGDTVCIEGGLRPISLRLVNFHGTADQPITLINYGGVVTIVENDLGHGAAFKLVDSSHVRLTGSGDNNTEYGIRIKGVGIFGLKLESKNTDIEIDHVEVFGSVFAGIMIKTDPEAKDPSTWRDNFTMYNITVRNNYVHDVDAEGMYIGHTSYHEGALDNGTLVWPHAIKGLFVHDNLIERTGWDGLQVASATDNVAVYNNIIRDYGIEDVLWQNNGLQIGPGSTGAYYNNIIERARGTGSGINTQGHGDQIFYNNLIIAPKGTGIISMERINREKDAWYGQDNPIYFVHNTIVNPAGEGIDFWNTKEFHKGSAAYNNLIVMGNSKGKAFDFEYPEESEMTLANNLVVNTLEEAGFVDPENGNYKLRADSAAIGFGLDLTAFDWASAAGVDRGGMIRRVDGGYDAGAYEFEFQKRTVEIDGSEREYLVYVPADYDPARTYPFIVFNHGDGEKLKAAGGAKAGLQALVGIGPAIANSPLLKESIIYLPQYHENDNGAEFLIDQAQRVAEAFNTDPTRWYMTGISAGGYITWNWGGKRQQLYAALMPIAGGLSDTSEEQLGKLALIPIRAFHGDADDVIALSWGSQAAVDLVEAAGGDVELKVYPGVGHNSWDLTYGNEDNISWLLSQRNIDAYTLESSAAKRNPQQDETVNIALQFNKPGGYPVTDYYFNGSKKVKITGYDSAGGSAGTAAGAALLGAETEVVVQFDNGKASIPLKLNRSGEQKIVFAIEGVLTVASEPIEMNVQRKPTTSTPDNEEPDNPAPSIPAKGEPEPTKEIPAKQPVPQPVPADTRNHWASDAIKQLAGLGALVTEKDGAFHPNKEASRAEFIDMLVRALGLQSDEIKPFADTNGHWAQESIAIAAALGLVSGYNDSTFGPERQISREEMAVILFRALKLQPEMGSGTDSSFKDQTSVSGWALAAVRAATKLDLLSGYPDGSFQPKRSLSRAEAAIIIVRIWAYMQQ